MPKCNVRRKAQLGLDIREGGIAIPIANNMFYINGRKHAAGGVAIGPNNKNGVEVEGGEVVEMIDSNHPSVGRQFKAGGQQQTMRVFSSVPFLRGASPAELVLGGANPDAVFKAQEEFKDRNRINDDGTTYQNGGQKKSNSAIRTEADKKVPAYNRAVYSLVDPTMGYPTKKEAFGYAIGAGIKAMRNPNDMVYWVTDSVSDAAWRKRHGLSYDNKFLIPNEDGSVRLPKDREMEIPTDTTMLKNRIAANEKLAKRYPEGSEKRDIVDWALKVDGMALDSLRHTYRTGEPVTINEGAYNSRRLINNGELSYPGIMPHNVMQNYAIQYDKSKDKMNYWDTYNFNQFEWGVPGKPFEIKGSIPLKKAGGIYIKPSKRGTFTAAATKHGMDVQEFASKVLANKEDYSSTMIKKANFARNASRWKKEYGGDDTKTAVLKRLRNKFTIRGNYNGGMFGGAGAGSVIMAQPEYITDTITKRYLVPVTQNFNDAFGDAVNAGLDKFMFDNKWYNTEKGNNPNNNSAGAARTQTVYLPIEHKEVRRRKKEFGGRIKAEIGTYQPKRNNRGQIVLNPNNPDDVKWLHEQQGKRGTKAVHRGQQEFLEGALNRTTPIMLGVAMANPITTATSLAGGYLLGEVGELGGELYKSLTGEDYTREGKVIGQTIGGLGGPIGAKLFGKGATNAWNAYKSNRLNSTQTLVDVPETGLTVRPNVRVNRPKQLGVTDNQKYLPTDVEDLTWKEPKALLETQAQVTRRDLKNFNRWAKLFGYEPVPLRYAETKSIADRHVQDRIRQHNTFLRGVAKPNKLQKQAIEYELAKEGITNPTDYDVYTYMATHSAPTTGAGRADLRPIQVRKRKVGNFNLSKTSDSPIGALYTQGSGRGAAGYAGMGPESGGHRRTGVVVEVARPTNFRPEASYAEWVKENDFNFGDAKSKGFHKKVANRVVETGKAPEAYNLSAEDKQVLFNEIKNEFAARPEPVYETAKHALDYIKTHRPNILKNITQLDESAFNSLSNDSKRAYNKYLGKLMMLNPKTVSFSKEVKEENNRFKNTYRGVVILEGKRRKNKYLSDIDYNPEDYTQPDFSVLKSTSRNRGNAQQHYIFRAPIGEKILEGRGFYLPTEEEIINATTDHYSLWTPGYSRNTRKFGGIKKFKFGGNMIYTINGNVRNGLSLRPKAKYGTIDKNNKDVKVGPDGLIYKRAADGEWYTDGTVHVAFKKASPSGLNKPNSSNAKKFNYTAPEPKRVYIDHSDYEEEKETKKIGSLTYEKNESGKWVPASKQSTTTTRDGGRPKDFGITRTGVNHPNGNYRYHPLTGEKISKMGVVETSEPSVKGTTKVTSKSSSTPRGEGTTSASSASSRGTAKVESPKPATPTNPNEARYASRVQKGQAQEVTPKPVVEYNEAADKNPDKYRYTRSVGFKAGKSPSSTGGGTQPKDGPWIPQYNTITGRDWLGVGTNLAGHIASYFANNSLLKKYPMPNKPIMTPVVKLKTKHNIEPGLTNINETTQVNRGVVRRNTQSSNTSLAREQRLANEARNAKNQLYGQKENIETQLINQDRRNRQDVYSRNIAAYNDWLNKTYIAKSNQLLSKQQNMMNLINGIPMAVNNIIGTIESRRATNNTIKAIAAANPNVDGRMFGIGDYYTQRLADGRTAIYNKNHKLVKYV